MFKTKFSFIVSRVEMMWSVTPFTKLIKMGLRNKGKVKHLYFKNGNSEKRGAAGVDFRDLKPFGIKRLLIRLHDIYIQLVRRPRRLKTSAGTGQEDPRQIGRSKSLCVF